MIPSAGRSHFQSLFNFHPISFESILHTHVTWTVYKNKMNLSIEIFIWQNQQKVLGKTGIIFACVFVYADLSTSAARHKTCSHNARSWLWTFRTSSSFDTWTTLFLTSASDRPSANNHPLPSVCFLIGLFYWKDFKNRKENREEENDLLNPFHCFNRQLRLHLLMQK